MEGKAPNKAQIHRERSMKKLVPKYWVERIIGLVRFTGADLDYGQRKYLRVKLSEMIEYVQAESVEKGIELGRAAKADELKG